MHALFRTQKQLKEENGGRDVLSDADVLNQSRGLIAAGRNTFLIVVTLKNHCTIFGSIL